MQATVCIQSGKCKPWYAQDEANSIVGFGTYDEYLVYSTARVGMGLVRGVEAMTVLCHVHDTFDVYNDSICNKWIWVIVTRHLWGTRVQ
jgi:hypothetical protein